MKIVVLGASGGTGRQLVTRALADGHNVRALVRNPDSADFATHPHLEIARADVNDAASIAAVIGADDVVVSGLGVRTRDQVGTLSAGARAVIAAHPARIVWLGAAGTGESASKVGGATAWLLRRMFGPEYDDKVAAERAVLAVGGSVVHSGPLNDKSDDPGITVAPLAAARKRFFPRGASRASIARLMIGLATESSESSADLTGVFLVQ